MFLCPFGLYRTACFGILFVSILCTCCSHFFWYCFISSTVFCAPVFSLIHWFFTLSNFVIPSKCLKNFICAASKRCSSLFFSIQASLPNFNAALTVMLWILNFVSLFICFPKCLRIAPFILLSVCNLSSKSLLYSDVRYPRYNKISYLFNNIVVYTTLLMLKFKHIQFRFYLEHILLKFLNLCTSPTSHARHIPRPSHDSLFHQPKYVWTAASVV